MIKYHAVRIPDSTEQLIKLAGNLELIGVRHKFNVIIFILKVFQKVLSIYLIVWPNSCKDRERVLKMHSKPSIVMD